MIRPQIGAPALVLAVALLLGAGWNPGAAQAAVFPFPHPLYLPETPPESTPSGIPSAVPSGQPSPVPLRAPVPPATPPAPPNIISQSRPEDPAAGANVAPPGVDALPNPGYVPGYRTYQGLSLSPHAPRATALPGGVTPAYGAPMPLDQWTFQWNGNLNASLQQSVGRRAVAAPGQGTTIFNAPPRTIDEYASFVGTSTMPGQWAALNFVYAKQVVSVNLAINTWNPTEPTTYYQIGSQLFINTFYLSYDIPPLGKLKLRAQLGYFPSYAGSLGQYGPGMYTNQMVGVARGVGEDVTAEYPISPVWSVLFEHGFMGNRNGHVAIGVVPTGGNGGANPIFPANWINHVHLGVLRSGEPTFKAQIHFLTNWAHDDRTMQAIDNRATRAIDEAHPRDGRLDVLGVDATVNSRTWGYFGVGGSFVKGDNAFTLKGVGTFGGDGQTLTERWWGPASGGTGKLFVAGLNYSASLGRILTAPLPFTNDRPDLVLNTGFVIAYTLTDTVALQGTTLPAGSTMLPPLPADVDIFNHRLRYKLGADLLYTFSAHMGAGARVDRVAPTSKDGGETFHVLAARLVFKSNWSTRDSITIIYGKWFYGPRSHPETNSIVASDVGRLDDQLIAINANLSW